MTPIRKVLLAGLAVCAMALTGMSVAWACSPNGSIVANPSQGLAGSVVDISGTGFMSPTEKSQDQPVGQVEIRWNTTTGPLLATAPAPDFTQPVTVPQTASARTYYFVAVQRRSDGAVVRQGAASFQVTAPQREPAPGPAPVQQPPPAEASAPAPQEAGEGSDETTATPVAAEPTSATDPGTVEATQPGRAGRRTAADAGSGVARSTRSGAAIAAGPPTDPGLPAEAAPPPPPPPAAPEISPLSVSGDMGAAWQSSISATRGPSLTAPVASPPAGAAGLGLALLAVGSAGLFAGALVGLRSRRRVATGRSS